MSILGSFSPNAGTYTVYTDAQGRYNFQVTPGAYTLTAKITSDKIDPSWDSTGDMDWTVPLVLAANEEAVANFATAGTGSMQGKVVFDNNEVIPNAQVMCTWEGMDGILPSGDDVTFYFTTDADGNFLAEGIPGGQFTCEGKDPNSEKTSSPVTVAVDQTDPEPAAAELVVPTITTTPAKPKLAFTGSNVTDMIVIASGSLILGLIMTLVHFFMLGRRRRKTEEN